MTLDTLPPATAQETIRVAVFDRRPLAADGFAALLSRRRDVNVVGVGTSARAAVRLLASTPVDVVVVGITPTDVGSAIRLMDRIGCHQPAGAHRMVGVVSGDQQVADLIGGPSVSVVTTKVDADTLREVVASATPRDVVTIPALVIKPPAAYEQSAAPRRPGLTRREQQVLRGIKDGLSTNEIATQLGIAPNTVRTHAQRLMSKLAVHSRVHAAAIAATEDYASAVGG